MYERFMNLVESHSEKIMKNVTQEVRKREDTRHYWEISEGATGDRIAHVIRNVYMRLGDWLNKDKPKNTLFAYYSDLGENRCKEGIPLDEVVMVFQLIKRAIWHELKGEIAVDNSFTLNQFAELNHYVDLFFDRIIHALIVGYQVELGKTMEKAGKEKHLLAKIFQRQKDTEPAHMKGL
jgi:hypothetical protein